MAVFVYCGSGVFLFWIVVGFVVVDVFVGFVVVLFCIVFGCASLSCV